MIRVAGLLFLVLSMAATAGGGSLAQELDFNDLKRPGPPLVQRYTIPGLAKEGSSIIQRFGEVDSGRIGAARSSSGGGSGLRYGCKFCCEGKWGACRTEKMTVNTPATNSADAQEYVRREYKAMCQSVPFDDSNSGTASVGYPSCETYYYK